MKNMLSLKNLKHKIRINVSEQKGAFKANKSYKFPNATATICRRSLDQ